MVYLYYISCLGYTILVGNPRNLMLVWRYTAVHFTVGTGIADRFAGITTLWESTER